MKRLAQRAGILIVVVLVASLGVLGNGVKSGYEGSVELDIGILPSFLTTLGADLILHFGDWSLSGGLDLVLYPPITVGADLGLKWTSDWLSISGYTDLGIVPFGLGGVGLTLKATAEPWWVTSDTFLTFGTFALSENLELGVTFLNAKLDSAGTTTFVGKATAGLSIASTSSGLLTATFTFKAGDLTVESGTWVSLPDFTIGESITLSLTFAPITAKAWVDFNSAGALTIGIGATWKFSG
jgi:hypothetical protein